MLRHLNNAASDFGCSQVTIEVKGNVFPAQIESNVTPTNNGFSKKYSKFNKTFYAAAAAAVME